MELQLLVPSQTGRPLIGMLTPVATNTETNANYGFKNFTARAIRQGGTAEAKREATPPKP